MRPRLFWIADPNVRLAIMPRPRGGDDLPDEMRALRQMGANVLVCLLTSDEMNELDLTNEPEAAQSAGLTYLSLPIPDACVPNNANAFRALTDTVVAQVRSGRGVVIHCRGGIGRSSIVAACVLHAMGSTPEAALETLTKCRGVHVPDTDEQKRWIMSYRRNTK